MKSSRIVIMYELLKKVIGVKELKRFNKKYKKLRKRLKREELLIKKSDEYRDEIFN